MATTKKRITTSLTDAQMRELETDLLRSIEKITMLAEMFDRDGWCLTDEGTKGMSVVLDEIRAQLIETSCFVAEACQDYRRGATAATEVQ